MLKIQRSANGRVVFTLSGRIEAEDVKDFGTRHWHSRANFLCLHVCLGKSAQETLLGGVYLPDLLQRRLEFGCLATADGKVMQAGGNTSTRS